LAPQAEAYQALLASQHSTVLPPRWLEFQHGAQRCGDWLRGVRRVGAATTEGADQIDKSAALVQYQWLVGALYKNKQLQYAQLLGPWLQQLFSSAGGYKLQIRLLAVDADLSLPPLEQQHAQQLLADLYHWLSESLNRPLPVELHSACLWLQAELSVDAPLPDKVAAQLQKLYEGDGFSSGRVERNRYLARAYPDFYALWQQGEMAKVATALYQPLRQYLLNNGIMERG
jgi:exodeoxyribonuclease V gamma subunit